MERTLELRVLRGLLLAIIAFTMAGTFAELLLLEHYETTWQLAPLISLGVGLVAVVAVALRPTRAVLTAFRYLMAALVLAGMVGVLLHLKGNQEFALETYAGLEGWALFTRAATGATPLLAPGAIAQLGLLGLLFTYRHPGLQRR